MLHYVKAWETPPPPPNQDDRVSRYETIMASVVLFGWHWQPLKLFMILFFVLQDGLSKQLQALCLTLIKLVNRLVLILDPGQSCLGTLDKKHS